MSKRGYLVSFIEDDPVELQTDCPICSNVLFEPVIATCCGYDFCSSCIAPLQEAARPCPMCDQTSFLLLEDKLLDVILNELEVYCPNRDKGCNWAGKLGECDGHLGQRSEPGSPRLNTLCQFQEILAMPVDDVVMHGECHSEIEVQSSPEKEKFRLEIRVLKSEFEQRLQQLQQLHEQELERLTVRREIQERMHKQELQQLEQQEKNHVQELEQLMMRQEGEEQLHKQELQQLEQQEKIYARELKQLLLRQERQDQLYEQVLQQLEQQEKLYKQELQNLMKSQEQMHQQVLQQMEQHKIFHTHELYEQESQQCMLKEQEQLLKQQALVNHHNGGKRKQNKKTDKMQLQFKLIILIVTIVTIYLLCVRVVLHNDNPLLSVRDYDISELSQCSVTNAPFDKFQARKMPTSDLQSDSDSNLEKNHNIIIHIIIATLLMIAFLQCQQTQKSKSIEVRDYNVIRARNLSLSAYYLHDQRNEIHLFSSSIPSINNYFQCANNIASVHFIDEIEVLACDSRGCEYWNPDHDITIRIPAGAIPLDMTVQLEVAIALYGPFQFPNSSFPVSPILWLCSQKEITFRKPIEIILPHFVNNTKNFGINFAKADHKWYSTNESGTKHYVFNPVGTAFISIKEGTQNYGFLSINHCCYFCITTDSSFSSDLALGAGYCFWCIEKPLSPPQSRDKVLLCATFFLSTCSTALKLQYPASEGYHIHEPIVFQFQKPEDGSEPYISVSIQDERCVVAANRPSRVITASQVYFWNQSTENLERMHKERIYPPKVTLTLELSNSCSTKPVPIQISVSGAQNDLNKEVLLPLASAGNTVQHNSPTISVTKWQSTGHRPELKNLLIELRNEVAHEWEDLGIILGIEPGTLEAIKTTENSTAQSRLREILKIWQKRITPPPS